MSRYERGQFLERLCTLRAGYGQSAEDTRGSLSIEDAMTYATAVMVALEAADADDEAAIAAHEAEVAAGPLTADQPAD